MELSRRNAGVALGGVLIAAALILVVNISSFGIWDPWELNPADQARDLISGEDVKTESPPLPTALVATGFAAFGVREWAGRLPIALAGLCAVLLAYFLVARFAGRRAGVYAALVTATSPLFLFNARQMLGDAPAFAAQALIALCAAAAVFHPREGGAPTQRTVTTAIWLGGMVVGILLAIVSRGALLGAAPPLLAVAVATGLDGILIAPRRDPRRAAAGWIVVGTAALVILMVTLAVYADQDAYSRWTGGKPQGGNPPSFEAGIEQIFHSFAPWSALAILALGRMLWPVSAAALATATSEGGAAAAAPDAAPRPSFAAAEVPPTEAPVRIVLVLWAAFAYAAHSIYVSRYGGAPYIAVVALAGAVAIFLRDVERSGRSWWAAAVVVALFVALIIRDYALYPSGPIAGLGLSDVTVPDAFNPKKEWAVVLGLFTATAVLCLGPGPDLRGPLDLRAPYRWGLAQWKHSVPNKIWMIVLGLVMVALLIVGALAWILGDHPDIEITSIAIRWARRLMFLPLLIPVAAAAVQVILWATSRMGQFRLVPLLLAAVIVAGYSSQGFLPALSAHFSPREIYDTFNTLARRGEPLGEFRVSGRAATYYARGNVQEIETQQALIDFLADETQRRWAAFPADELAAVNRAYRRRRGEHLFIADARSARVVLATNQPVRGTRNQNFVAESVRESPPESIQHRVNARYEDKIELLGFDLDLPNDGYVGAGQTFAVTWYWKALRQVPGGFKIFLHVDGQGNRLNGDHDPVDGRYPVRLWDEGDVVVDRQELTVPANYRPGTYTFYIGFYSGSTRLHVEQGREDDADRVIAGTVMVR